MTERDIELDALVAERVMGWQWFPSRDNKEQYILAPSQQMADTLRLGQDVRALVPPCSVNIHPAWQAAVKLGLFSRNFKWRGIETLGMLLQHNPKTDTWAALVRYYDSNIDVVVDNCASAERAICLAALKAVGAEVQS